MGCFCPESFEERNEALLKCINDITGMSFDLGLPNNNRTNEVMRKNDNQNMFEINLFNNNNDPNEKNIFQNIQNQAQNKIEQFKRLDINKSDLNNIYEIYENSKNLFFNNQNNDIKDNNENIIKENDKKEYNINKNNENEMKSKKEEDPTKNYKIAQINKNEDIKNNKINTVKKEEPINKKETKDSLKFNKELCKSIASSLPKREETNYQSLKNIMKSKTEKLSDKEKSYIVFLWVCDNISYDVDSYYAGSYGDCSPEGVFRKGSSVCSGYSRLYKDISLYLDLEVECVNCYAKGVSYSIGQKMTKTNHEYNVIKLNNKWYPIDSTWGAGSVNDKRFHKKFNEFYFLADPELLIKTHFPADNKWQLTQKIYTLDEFLKWPQVRANFYKYGFEKYYPEEGVIELNNRNNQQFIIYGNNMKKKDALCNIYLLENNCYKQQSNMSIINFYNDRFEVKTLFNKKGKYKIQIYGNDGSEEQYYDMLEYVAIVKNDALSKLEFPQTYKEAKNINIIEPLYNNLKTGKFVKFKMTSNYDDINNNFYILFLYYL